MSVSGGKLLDLQCSGSDAPIVTRYRASHCRIDLLIPEAGAIYVMARRPGLGAGPAKPTRSPATPSLSNPNWERRDMPSNCAACAWVSPSARRRRRKSDLMSACADSSARRKACMRSPRCDPRTAGSFASRSLRRLTVRSPSRTGNVSAMPATPHYRTLKTIKIRGKQPLSGQT